QEHLSQARRRSPPGRRAPRAPASAHLKRARECCAVDDEPERRVDLRQAVGHEQRDAPAVEAAADDDRVRQDVVDPPDATAEDVDDLKPDRLAPDAQIEVAVTIQTLTAATNAVPIAIVPSMISPKPTRMMPISRPAMSVP